MVGIGMSAGGLEAATAFFRALGPETGMTFACVPHLDPRHASELAAILARATAMPVEQVTEGVPFQPDHVYVIPPGSTMVVEGDRFHLSPRQPDERIHHPVDAFFESLAASHGHRAVGILLSGMGTDGTLGLAALKAAGGLTFAQDATAHAHGMPGSAAESGCVDHVLPPERIAQEIERVSRHPYVAHPGDQAAPDPAQLREMLERLRAAKGVDFARYKSSTLKRRAARRMALHETPDIQDYLRILDESPAEVEALYQDILIGVTSFFRDTESFEALKSDVFPALTAGRGAHEPLRAWALGCSTGEEAYSIAMAYAEYAEAASCPVPIQVFATDLNEAAIDRARAGVFPKHAVRVVSPERLRRFFLEVDGGHRVIKPIRDACVFARHDGLNDPPFSRIDLVACRNLVIYLDPALQQQLMPRIHHALRPGGILWTGSSESIRSYGDLFGVMDAKHRFFSRKPVPARAALGSARPRPSALPPPPAVRVGDPPGSDLQREADKLLLNRHAPPSVVVAPDMEILQFRGDTSAYLAPPTGRATLNLLKMLREGLLVGVRGAALKARREGRPAREERLVVKAPDGPREVDVEVMPLGADPRHAGCLLVVFDDGALRGAPARRAPRKRAGETRDRQIARLTQELAATREYLQSVIEQQEVANESLQSANEEIQSSNEELQSINEELETSKEEIQSSNEELATLNDELQHRNAELATINDDLLNLLASVQVPIVMLGPNLRIRRFTPTAERTLNLIPADVGRPFSDLQLHLELPDLREIVESVMESGAGVEREVRDVSGRWHLLRIRPYHASGARIDGAVVLLIDVDELKRGQEALKRQADLLAQTREPIVMWRFDDGRIRYWNAGAEALYGVPRDGALGQPIHDLLGAPSGRFREALERDGSFTGDVTCSRPDGAQVVVESRMTLADDPRGERVVIQADHDVTQRLAMERSLRDRARELVEADRVKNEFLAMLAHELRNPLAPLLNAVNILKLQGSQGQLEELRGMIERQVHRMARMIGDLLDVSRVTQGKVELRKVPVDLWQVVGMAVEMARSRIDDRQQRLEISRPAERTWVDADPVRLEQVFANILDNASKFTPPGGRIRLTVERRPVAGARGEAVVRIHDDGAGVAREVQPRVFDLFVQERAPDRPPSGLGIGLTLVKQLVEMHGGRAELESEGTGRGTTVTVTLPVVPPPSLVEEPQRTRAPDAARRVLVVDDNVDAAVSTAELLRLAGHGVDVAHDGPTALALAGGQPPDVVLLDLGMPGMDGVEVALRLRSLPSGERMVIVAVTGGPLPADAPSRAAFDGALSKPVRLDEFRAALRRTRSA